MEIVDSFQGKFKNQANFILNSNLITVYEAWNENLKYVDSDYIAIWNVDDYRTDASLEMQAHILDNSDVSSVAGPFTIVDRYGSRDGHYVDHFGSQVNQFMRGMRHGPFFMFRAKDLELLRGFDEQYKICADYDFAVRLSSLGEVGYTRESLGYYLNSRSGVSTGGGRLLDKERESIYLRYGIFDKFDLTFLPDALHFDLTRIRVRGDSFPLSESMQNYIEINGSLSQRPDEYFWMVQLTKRIRAKVQRRYRIVLREILKKLKLLSF
jgi:hypothetical protein